MIRKSVVGTLAAAVLVSALVSPALAAGTSKDAPGMAKTRPQPEAKAAPKAALKTEANPVAKTAAKHEAATASQATPATSSAMTTAKTGKAKAARHHRKATRRAKVGKEHK